MKKVKMMLAITVIVAAVGGTLAFKATKSPNKFYTCNTIPNPDVCQEREPGKFFRITTGTGEVTIGAVSQANLNGQLCPGVCDKSLKITAE